MHSDTEDMRAVYMRSVRSPVQGRYKLKYQPNVHVMDVYSQVPDPMEASEYQEDSFCVGDDFHDTGLCIEGKLCIYIAQKIPVF